MVRTVARFSLIALLSLPAPGQPAKVPSFEVTSVKPESPNSLPSFQARGGPGTDDPERIIYRNNSMLSLVMTAYGLKSSSELSGPTWLDKEKYDIIAKLPPRSTKEQLNPMLIGLLEERFRMKVHRESRTLPIYELAVVKRGVIEKAQLESPRPSNTPLPAPAQDAGVVLNRDARADPTAGGTSVGAYTAGVC